MRRALDLFYSLLMALAALAMVATFVVVILGIADRQLGLGLRGLDAYAGYGIAAALFLALPGTFVRDEHIRVTLALQAVPARVRAALELWCLAAGVVTASLLAWYACKLVWMSHGMNDVSPAADATPLWIPQIAMALGCVGFAVSMLDALASRLAGKTFFRVATADAVHAE